MTFTDIKIVIIDQSEVLTSQVQVLINARETLVFDTVEPITLPSRKRRYNRKSTHPRG